MVGESILNLLSSLVSLLNSPSLFRTNTNADADLRKREATGRVAKVAREKQVEIMESMETRIQNVKEMTALIERPPESMLKAIEVGTAVTKDAAEKTIAAKSVWLVFFFPPGLRRLG